MNRAGRSSAVAAFFLLILLGSLTGEDARQFSKTTYGEISAAHGVLFDTLVELGVPVSRSFAAPERLPPGGTVWWIEPPLSSGTASAARAG